MGRSFARRSNEGVRARSAMLGCSAMNLLFVPGRLCLLGALLAALSGCGSSNPFVGTWEADVQTASGETEEPVLVKVVLVFTAKGWQVGGGCEAPLTYQESIATLTTPNWSCPLQSAQGLPFTEFGQYTWKSG